MIFLQDLNILYSEKKLPSTVIIKHANPCGVSSNKSPLKSFINAQASDPSKCFWWCSSL